MNVPDIPFTITEKTPELGNILEALKFQLTLSQRRLMQQQQKIDAITAQLENEKEDG